MNLLYLGVLLLSITGMLILDARYRLFVWRAPVRALLVLLAGMVMLVIADGFGIAAGIFRIGETPYLSGIVLGPELPVEELFFLFFLCQLTMVVHELARRMHRPRERS